MAKLMIKIYLPSRNICLNAQQKFSALMIVLMHRNCSSMSKKFRKGSQESPVDKRICGPWDDSTFLFVTVRIHIGSKTNQTNFHESFVLLISWEAFGIVSLPFGRPILGRVRGTWGASANLTLQLQGPPDTNLVLQRPVQ